MGTPLDARSAREALIVEALRGVDTVLAAADAVGERLSASSQRLESAAAGLTAAGTVYSAEVAQLTESTKKALADYIERRASVATASACDRRRFTSPRNRRPICWWKRWRSSAPVTVTTKPWTTRPRYGRGRS